MLGEWRVILVPPGFLRKQHAAIGDRQSSWERTHVAKPHLDVLAPWTGDGKTGDGRKELSKDGRSNGNPTG